MPGRSSGTVRDAHWPWWPPQKRNLPQLGSAGMLSTLRQQFPPSLLAQMLQHVQLLLELLGATADAGFSDLSQPLCSMTGIVNVPARTGNRPATIHRFQAIHDSGEIFDDGQITPSQLPQHPHPSPARVDRFEMVAA